MKTPPDIQQFYAACPKGLENLLFNEIKGLGVVEPRETGGGVYFSGHLVDAYRICLWSRLANKVLLPLASVDILRVDDLYDAVINIAWEEHLLAYGLFKVDFTGTNDFIRNSQFGAVRVKDGIVDRFRQQASERPSVSKDHPDLVINARLSKGKAGNKDKLHLSIDLSGQSLHRRGYRTKQGVAPLKENLAAAVLLRAQWPAMAEQGGALIDPMCGSATLLIEGVLMAADIAPGLLRHQWGFSRWRQFEQAQWQFLMDEAEARRAAGIEKLQQQAFEARGYDIDHHILRAAESNIALAGLSEFIRVVVKGIDDLKRPTHKVMDRGLIICNPPYGERLGEERALLAIYRQLGTALKEEFTGWQAGIFTANTRLAKNMGIRARKIYKLFNARLATDLLYFDIQEKAFVRQPTLANDKIKPATVKHNTPVPITFDDLTPGAQMVCHRLKKNQKQLRKWLTKNDIECYRLYDADMPEYAAAIDVYGQWVHVQEYTAPKSIDAKKAQYRFDELLSAIIVALKTDKEQLFVKQRQRNKGTQQYQRLEQNNNRAMISVTEPAASGSVNCLVNLWSYLDSGLFLDHRPVRQMIGQMSQGKTFLNLFCYTATATLHAALGGATSSTSVDMSKTYLDWAEKNFRANYINTQRHQLVRDNCTHWLNNCREGFDVILLDPPSFSNSKRMQGVFDVQRDHGSMIHRCMELLTPGGTLVFSSNLRSFTLDKVLTEIYQVEDITQKTLDVDFQRNKKIHYCFLIKA
ncbi:23S rRNA (guanine(2445)-N(2))/(guanine(2069)-N(7))-methyltransferase [Candidatus Endobugula sertula]|uniref:Ribosomal RNA large subunit methyltransferase K/L n=1 Tax=Candidatus Endobugula sertula TaxID=62101 RepID=A0A1D2QLM4_9GAMM|nr:23S rRNA (guanine(2445)-N(2))/(guanine(2069)-N(7))-methyltransferase [Candidatus Endobugula sertula]